MGDVLEHIDKKRAIQFLNIALKKCKYFILNIPIGVVWLQHGEIAGNPYERHISSWEVQDFNYYNILLMNTYYCNNKPINMYIFKGKLHENSG